MPGTRFEWSRTRCHPVRTGQWTERDPPLGPSNAVSADLPVPKGGAGLIEVALEWSPTSSARAVPDTPWQEAPAPRSSPPSDDVVGMFWRRTAAVAARRHRHDHNENASWIRDNDKPMLPGIPSLRGSTMTDLKRDQPCPNPQDLPPAVAHDQQSIKQPERDCRHTKRSMATMPSAWLRRNPATEGPSSVPRE